MDEAMEEDQAPIRESQRVKAAGASSSSSSSSSSSDAMVNLTTSGGAGVGAGVGMGVDTLFDAPGGASDVKGEPELVVKDKSVMIGSQGFKVT